MNSFTFFNVLVLLFAWLICFFPAAEKPIEESPWVDFVRAQKQFGLIPRSTSILRQGYSDIRKVGEILDELSGSVLNSTLVFRKPIVSQLQTVLDSATEADYRLLELEEAIRRAFDNVIKASQRNIHELEILLAPRDALTGFIPKSIQAYAVRRKRRRHLVSACDEMLTEVKPFMELIEGLEASLQFQSDSATALNTYFRRNNFRTSDHIGELLADLLSRVGPGTRGNRHNARVLLSHFFSHMEEATRHVELIQLVLESIMATIHGFERKLADGTILDEAIFPVRRDIAVLKNGFAALEKYKDILG